MSSRISGLECRARVPQDDAVAVAKSQLQVNCYGWGIMLWPYILHAHACYSRSSEAVV